MFFLIQPFSPRATYFTIPPSATPLPVRADFALASTEASMLKQRFDVVAAFAGRGMILAERPFLPIFSACAVSV
jgi:hypothetical protein